jgi:hypothetical protein
LYLCRRNGPWQTTLEAPAEGVKNLLEETDEEFSKSWSTLQRRQALLLQFITHLNFEWPWTCATNKGRAYYWRRGSKGGGSSTRVGASRTIS